MGIMVMSLSGTTFTCTGAGTSTGITGFLHEGRQCDTAVGTLVPQAHFKHTWDACLLDEQS